MTSGIRFGDQVRAVFWRAKVGGASVAGASAAAGVSFHTGRNWFREADGMGELCLLTALRLPLPEPRGRYLCLDERIVICVGLRDGLSKRKIAEQLGRSAATISDEVARNRCPDGIYRPGRAQIRADGRRSRSRPGKLAKSPWLASVVEWLLTWELSPQQIARRLRRDFSDDASMHISHETIYQALYVQGRGELRAELARHLRTGRTRRKPHSKTAETRGKLKDMVSISERPPEVADRAIPGHWEGDLIIGKGGTSAIGTLVERTTRFVILLHLNGDHSAATVAAAMLREVQKLPAHMRLSLTWDQGKEMALHKMIADQADMAIFFCDPHSPWQRGSNENTNGLLRQYFPKGTDLSVHTQQDLDHVALRLNTRPRQTLDWDTPAERLAPLLLAA